MKYTLIYSRSVPLGSHRVFSVGYDQVETTDLKTLLLSYVEDIQFIFVGWPSLEGKEANAKLGIEEGLC